MQKSFQIKPLEIPLVQFVVNNYRSDLRPQVALKQKRVLDNYSNTLLDLIYEVKYGPLQTLELALKFEKKNIYFRQGY